MQALIPRKKIGHAIQIWQVSKKCSLPSKISSDSAASVNAGPPFTGISKSDPAIALQASTGADKPSPTGMLLLTYVANTVSAGSVCLKAAGSSRLKDEAYSSNA